MLAHSGMYACIIIQLFSLDFLDFLLLFFKDYTVIFS